jgi:hypothetical protein
MPDPSTLRDSTQIILSSDVLAEFRADLDEQFTLTFIGPDDESEAEYVRIIGSPVEIKAANDFLSRHGVSLR